MNPRVTEVEPNSDHTLNLHFNNDETRVFDVKPYLDKGIFAELRDLNAFNSVKPAFGGVLWAGGQDLCPDRLYDESVPVDPTRLHIHVAK